MRLIMLGLAAALLFVSDGFAGGPRSAQAEVWYPWCARYGGGRLSPGVPICGYTSYRQCMASVQGMGGYCEQNWPPPAGANRRR
jgi:hypothetical protein